MSTKTQHEERLKKTDKAAAAIVEAEASEKKAKTERLRSARMSVPKVSQAQQR